MADTFVDIRLHISDNAASVEDRLAKAADNRHGGASALLKEIQAIMSGTKQGKIVLGPIDSATDTDTATADIQIVHANIATDQVEIGGVAFVEGTDFQDGADEIEAAANLATAINASAALKGIVSAVSDGVDTVTLTYYKPGREGNLITLTTDDATGFVLSAAALGGAQTTQQAAPRTWSFGVA